jgi:hypothetical protein
MEGMLLAFSPRVQVDKGVALSPRLAVLLERKIRPGSVKGLERRLARMQGVRTQVKSGETKEILGERKV